MFAVDVPMYWSRWEVDRASGKEYLSFLQGVYDAASRRVVTHRWEDWRSEVIWMSLYFSVAVWLSIALIQASARYLAGMVAPRRMSLVVGSAHRESDRHVRRGNK